MSNHVFVVRRYSALSASWNEHEHKTFDEAVEIAAAKIREGGTTTRLEVIEVAEVRRVVVEAQIATIDITEGDAR